MLPVAAKVLVGLLFGGGLLALASSSAKAAQAGPGEQLPADLASRVVMALASKDPRVMRAVAAQLRSRGFGPQADKLEAAAAVLERNQAAGTAPGSGTTSPAPASSSAGSVPVAGSGPVTDAKQLLAAAVVRSITSGKPDVQKLRTFQTQEGLTPDGAYGPKTATSLIKYGFVPPTPTAWPKANAAAAKTAYAALLRVQADQDPLRREEWLQAAAAVGAPSSSSGPAPAGTGKPASAPTLTVGGRKVPTLKQGARGEDVKFLQRLLNQAGAAIVQDGNFTAAVKQTVISFQRGRHDAEGKLLVPDGVVGPKTWTALGAFN